MSDPLQLVWTTRQDNPLSMFDGEMLDIAQMLAKERRRHRSVAVHDGRFGNQLTKVVHDAP